MGNAAAIRPTNCCLNLSCSPSASSHLRIDSCTRACISNTLSSSFVATRQESLSMATSSSKLLSCSSPLLLDSDSESSDKLRRSTHRIFPASTGFRSDLVIPCRSKKHISERRLAADSLRERIWLNEICHVIRIEFDAPPSRRRSPASYPRSQVRFCLLLRNSAKYFSGEFLFHCLYYIGNRISMVVGDYGVGIFPVPT